MTQELSYVLVAGVFTILGSVIGCGVALYVSNRQREQERIKWEKDKKKEDSRMFLDESRLLLERAYETFTRAGVSPPKNNRRLWLSTARMISRFRNMRELLTEPAHNIIADEHEEYWRLRFHTLLQKNRNNLDANYFTPSGLRNKSDAIDITSIAVILDFSTWRNEIPDPLDSVNSKEFFAKNLILQDFPGVEMYLQGNKGYWAEVIRLRTARNKDT